MGALGVRHPGVVDQDVDRAERGLAGGDRGDQRIGIGCVHLHRQRLATSGPDLVGQGLKPVEPPRGQHHRCALAGEDFGEAGAEPR